MSEPNGWAIMHDRTLLHEEGEPFYLFGPLPSREIADLIVASLECECAKRVVPLFFPGGVTMRLEATMPSVLLPPPVDGHIH